MARVQVGGGGGRAAAQLPRAQGWGGLEEPQPGCETASPVPTALEVAQPRPSGESASPAVEPGSAPAASGGAELRPYAEASPTAAERCLASESAVAVAEPRSSGGAAQPVVERWPVPAASEVVEQRPSGEAGSPATERGFAPAASKAAELRPVVEAPLSTAERWPGDPPLSEEAVRRERNVSGRRGGLTPIAGPAQRGSTSGGNPPRKTQ